MVLNNLGIAQLLVVGLGNLPFPQTRHSVGHLIIDALAAKYGIPMISDRSLGGITGRSKVSFDDKLIDLTLFKPKPLMNITGPAVAAAFRKTVRSPNGMVIIHDSLSHKPKFVSVKFGGSANGHNGIRSVISALGGEMGFPRLRIGIGRDGGDAAEYVLSKLPHEEKLYWNEEGLDVVCRELKKIALKLPEI
ncbi:peptidyl-tRNA hydrolase [Hygrophoropsis aurantiaca]|uniref:Peptidyl-tRNA hydrolase n=1 Tax=Hygrophoropsis aurantiaca TaxID=72124 RepID=A0ACB8AJ55_9AGAM|nr:peptidyl-tRNA hydrolase [Hygrophoropsis aurantiaca]